ncbi:MAG: hypothetical protein HYY18_08105 [Planctomycetes bacterium]|nr:hypothetical protein [Planctomycetota bacterium]
MALRSLAAAALLLLPLAAAAQEPLPEKKTDNQAGNVKYLTPNLGTWCRGGKAGWTEFTVFVKEPDFCRIGIHPGRKLEGGFREAFEAEVAKVVGEHGAIKATNGVKESESREGFAVLQQSVEIEGKNGTAYAWFVGCHPGDRFELIVYSAGSEASWTKYAADAKAFVTNLKFANVADAPAGGVKDPEPAADPGPKAGNGYRAGDRVEILFGGTWYPGKVLEAGEGKWKVHYDGYGENWDSWVEAEKLRPAAGGAAAVAEPAADPGADPIVGERCQGLWDTRWYDIVILKVEAGRCFVHWVGYGDEKDEWIPRERIQRKGEDRDLPRKGREGNGGGQPPDKMVGQPCEVYWHGTWYEATVEKAEGKKLYVRYVQRVGTKAEWVVPERVREPGSECRYQVYPADVPGEKGIDGLHVRYFASAGGGVRREYLLFFADGRVYRGLMACPHDTAFKALRLCEPRNCGAYGITGGKIQFAYGGDAAETGPMTFTRTPSGKIEINDNPVHRVPSFKEGDRLDGEYLSRGNAFGTVGEEKDGLRVFSGVVCRFVFGRDGSFERIETRSAAADRVGGESTTRRVKGTYTIRANTLTAVLDDGRTLDYLIVPNWKDERRKESLVISEDEYGLVEK